MAIIAYQIRLLKDCKDYLCDSRGYHGICYALNQVADQGLYECMVIDNDFGIPLFTFDNAAMLADKYGFPKPINRNDVWWPLDEEGYKIRLAYIEAIINEIK
jgi:hypothetical protein